MGRLTYKTDNGEYTGMPNSVDTRTCLEKLAKLEDIEEELGIDLITLFKALKDGIWFKHTSPILKEEEPIIFSKGWRLGHNDPTNRYYLELGDFRSKILDDKEWLWELAEFRNYGKTWALTKEELEKK